MTILSYVLITDIDAIQIFIQIAIAQYLRIRIISQRYIKEVSIIVFVPFHFQTSILRSFQFDVATWLFLVLITWCHCQKNYVSDKLEPSRYNPF